MKDDTNEQVDQLFQESRAKYHEIFEVACSISTKQHGFDADGRGVRASSIFTRQCVIAATLDGILPSRSELSDPEAQLWDLCTFAAISRNLLEGYLALYYFGTQDISELEADLRFQLLQLHRNIEHGSLVVAMRPDDDHSAGENIIEEQKEKVRTHPYLNNLGSAQKNKALQFNEMYMIRREFEQTNPYCRNLRTQFRTLSNLIHPSPLYLHRSDNVNGRGIGSKGDIAYSGVCVSVASNYLAASVIDFADHFSDHFSEEIMASVGSVREAVLTQAVE